METQELQSEVCVVGGGSGGIGAALAAARAGADVILLERLPQLGGTSVCAYVCNWEAGPGDALAREIYDRLARLPHAVGIARDRNLDRSRGPFGLWLIEEGLTYEQTLQRAALPREEWRAVAFDPGTFAQVVSGMLSKTPNCRLLLGARFLEAETEAERVLAIRAESASGTAYRLRARVFIDCSGDVHLCRAAGCETMLGPESASQFGETSAPQHPGQTLNAISLCYRIRLSDNPIREPKPEYPAETFSRTAHVSSLPNGDRIVNPLAMLPGWALIEMGYEKAMAECVRRVRAHWQWLQGYPEFRVYEFHSCAPMLGIRESYRVKGEYILTQHDLEAGLGSQRHPDIVAVADHSMDVHGDGRRRVHGELKGPYGIPYRCLVPKGRTNLLVACRGASFSHIAASSCRLSRTIIALGRAAGLAAALAVRNDVPVAEIDMAVLQRELAMPPAAP